MGDVRVGEMSTVSKMNRCLRKQAYDLRNAEGRRQERVEGRSFIDFRWNRI